MKHQNALILLASVCLIAGCTTRGAYDAAGAAGGGALGYVASDGDPIATIGGAAGGVLVSEAMQYYGKKNDVEKYNRAYDKGASDATKRLYWAQQRSRQQYQAKNTTSTKVRYVEVPAPTTVQTSGGAIKQVQSTITIPVVETN